MNNKFEVVETATQPVLSMRAVTKVGNLPEVLGKAYNEIMAYLGELGVQPVDAPFAAYYNMDMENLKVEIGFPVGKAIAGQDKIVASQILGGKKAVCLYKGPYKEMGPIYKAMTQWINENGHHSTGVVYEFYYNSPIEVPESELLTKIMFLLK